jgi:hypothetical protein
MPSQRHKTVPDELLEYVDTISAHFRALGFKVHPERSELGFPYTPTFLCKRGRMTNVIVELDSKIPFQRLQQWVGYGRSCGGDTRVAVCVPPYANIPAAELAQLQQLRVGLYTVLPQNLLEQLAPPDLGINVALPPLENMPARIRELLGPSYEQFARAQWRECFEDACQVLEHEARSYLKRGIRMQRITILGKKGPVTLSKKQIDKFTMGKLANVFSTIQAQNHADAVIEQALKTINPDRVGVAHFKRRATTERRLRKNMGRHMWVIVAALHVMT